MKITRFVHTVFLALNTLSLEIRMSVSTSYTGRVHFPWETYFLLSGDKGGTGYFYTDYFLNKLNLK